jgi:hypothetical protein
LVGENRRAPAIRDTKKQSTSCFREVFLKTKQERESGGIFNTAKWLNKSLNQANWDDWEAANFDMCSTPIKIRESGIFRSLTV